jgi:hypothetical protein
MRWKINWDALGITASVACAIHCAILPLFLSSLPLFGVNVIENPVFEYGMIALAFCIGAYSLYHGHNRHHHSWLPLIIFAVGICFLLMKMQWHAWRLWLLIPAVVAIVSAHWLNFRLCRHHDHAHADDCDH